MFKFETLEIWQEAVNFVPEVYKLTKNFPSCEAYSLTSQLNRSAVSVSLNIAEGSSRNSQLDFKRFVQIALGSLYEVVTCLYVAKGQNYISKEEFNSTYEKCEQISKMLHGFTNYLNRRNN